MNVSGKLALGLFVSTVVLIALIIFLVRPIDPIQIGADRTETPAPIQTQPQALSTAANVQPSPTVIPTKRPIPQTQIQIVDALGDPVAAGSIIMDASRYPFEHGAFTTPPLSEGVHHLIAEADGYDSATRSIQSPRDANVSFTLEYNRSLKLRVYGDLERSRPLEGAVVELWNGPPVIRPPLTETSLLVRSLDRTDQRITVQRALDRFNISQIVPSDGKAIEGGNKILGISGYSAWHDRPLKFGANSSLVPIRQTSARRLRVWDALCAYGHNTRETGKCDDLLEYENNGSPQIAFVWRIPQSANNEVCASAKTDSNGIAQFNKIPAGSYYAKARLGDWQSETVFMHPARGGMEFYLKEAYQNQRGDLTITVLCQHAPLFMGAIKDADLLLRPTVQSKRSGLYAAKTDTTGRSIFTNLSFGEYRLSVTPPPQTPYSPKRVLIQIQERNQIETITLEGGVTVSGTVVRADNQEPVEEYVLNLVLEKPYDRLYHRGIGGSYASAQSGEDGKFIFDSVRPGFYYLSGHGASQYNGYLPQSDGVQRPDRGKHLKLFDRDIYFQVADKNVEDIEYKVLPGVKTTFSGVVVDKDGVPSSNAVLSLSRGERTFPFIEDNPKTNHDGRFHLTVISTAGDEERSETLTAKTYDAIQEERLTGAGSVPVKFKTGDEVTGLRIVVDKVKSLIVKGTITTEDDNLPGELNVTVSQDERKQSKGEISSDNSYQVECARLSPSRLIVTPIHEYIESKRYGRRSRMHYCTEFIPLTIPEDSDVLNVDVCLRQAGYLAGIVVDRTNSPIDGAVVQTSYESYGQNVPIRDETKEDGKFWITGFPLHAEYTLEVKMPGSDEIRQKITGLIPNDENIIVVID